MIRTRGQGWCMEKSSLAWFWVALPAVPLRGVPAADAQRGAEFFRTELCINCHAIRGDGGHVGPDLGRRLDRNYTPAGLASRMWNHAPVMWEAMKRQNIPLPYVSADQAADLFAF